MSRMASVKASAISFGDSLWARTVRRFLAGIGSLPLRLSDGDQSCIVGAIFRFVEHLQLDGLGDARRCGGRAAIARAADPELPDLVENRLVADAQAIGGLALVAAGVAQHDDDGLAL